LIERGFLRYERDTRNTPDKEHIMDPDKVFPATAMPDPDWWQALWPEPDKILEKLGFVGGMSALDLCCGDGLFTVPMSRMLQGNVAALDVDPVMLGKARDAVAKAGAPDCLWLEGDARDLGRFVPQKVDIVLIANTFHGVPDQAALTRGAIDVLKSAGAFIVVNWHKRGREETTVLGKPRGPKTNMRMSPDELCMVVEPCGLTLENVVDLPPYHYGAIFREP
jgi:SAM-dependent methyltransferase